MKFDNKAFLKMLIEERKIALAIGEVKGMHKLIEKRIKQDLEMFKVK